MAIGFSNSAAAECSKTIVIGWEDFPPYSLKDKEGNRSGLDVEITTTILRQAGCHFTFYDAPWKRLVEELRVGRVDILPGASKTEERDKFARFSIPYRQEVMSIFMRRNEAKAVKLNTLSDLKNYDLTIAAVLGTWYGPKYDQYSKQLHNRNTFVFIAQNENPFRMLSQKRVDMVFADYYSGVAEAADITDPAWVEVHDYPLNESAVHLMLSKKSTSKTDMENISLAAQQLLKTDQLADIVRRYGFEPLKVLHDPVYSE